MTIQRIGSFGNRPILVHTDRNVGTFATGYPGRRLILALDWWSNTDA